jgi:hypothetical protein
MLVSMMLWAFGCLPARISGGKFLNGPVKLVQSQDPKQPSTINQDSERIETLLVPKGSLIMRGTNSFKVDRDTTYVVSSHDKVNSTLGAAQKNSLAEVSAKLASLSWLTWLGAALVIFGAASAVYPPLKLLVNSLTTSAVCVAVGVGFIALPILLVGHEVLILCVGGGACLLYFFAHRHGGISGELKTLKSVFSAPAPTAPPTQPTQEGK